MNTPRTDRQLVTLLLHDLQGESWQLSLAADCLCFIGNYRRVEGFDVDAIVALDGLRKKG
ncbi:MULTISPECIES: hypothetical protein [Sphingobium]|jgi:hypothetical protein|uniref:Uncharacterized protein n=2 Tax=Sphingobium fuliginis (strain ATCC 27551) TaxID=336203 RepID=A0A4Q4IRH7_SPHSA|nr:MULTISPECIES: hypothetical protein [Sphingobium]OAP32871.1 hypothetical protein A8O16_05960 [Sphingobium sp. 20006FA]AJR25766.1 hypothetical protein TZ53_20480 [Sphingobium sp. YBL2]KXU32487.1 hypothetical protein AXW74_07025 [Sphingobium sp. AM]KYC32544.1 hypothetical protein A0J57_09725 [Sphingobium sp. 22B]MCB4860743.1 hypothetical protein [Sphingobium sp. PNB]